ncbi:hypothetical protein AB9M90_15680 [Bacillus safensis]|uniref:hypothetical protein n=1 Tax=Bacillus safensis TaxID=561879 RepID=UPI003512D3D9
MKYLILDSEKIPVEAALLSSDGKTLTAFNGEGKKTTLLEGVNLENVWLEDVDGNKINFDIEIDAKQEIAALKEQIKFLTETLAVISSTNEN